jgi:hypothetical protein
MKKALALHPGRPRPLPSADQAHAHQAEAEDRERRRLRHLGFGETGDAELEAVPELRRRDGPVQGAEGADPARLPDLP